MNISCQLLNVLGDTYADGFSKYLPPVFKNMSHIVDFLDRISPAPSQQVREAALIAGLFKTQGALSAIRLIKGNKDLIPDLDCEQHNQMIRIVNHMHKSIDHAVIAGAISVSWHAAATRQGNNLRTQSLFNMMSTVAASNDNKGATIAKSAIEVMTQIDAKPNESNEKNFLLFSISIDLAGSTQAKTEAMTVSPSNQQRIDEINIEIMRHFIKAEQEFYKRSCSRYTEGGGLEPQQFFSVKGIGDEMWILAESDRVTVVEAGRSLIDAALQISTQIFKHIAVENDDGPNWHPKFNYGKTQPLALGIKIFIDAVENATEISSVRDDAIHKAAPEILKERSGVYPNEHEIGKIIDRLLLGGFEPAGWMGFYKGRSDFIGHEIDRFFRTSKMAIPGMVIIGEATAILLNLKFQALDVDLNYLKGHRSLESCHPALSLKKATNIMLSRLFRPVFRVPIIAKIFWPLVDTVIKEVDTTDLFSVFLADGRPLRGGNPRDNVYAIKRILRAEVLKGIGYDYSTFALFAPRSLKAMLVQEEADKKNGFRTFPLDEVRRLLPDDTLQRLVAAEVIRNRTSGRLT